MLLNCKSCHSLKLFFLILRPLIKNVRYVHYFSIVQISNKVCILRSILVQLFDGVVCCHVHVWILCFNHISFNAHGKIHAPFNFLYLQCLRLSSCICKHLAASVYHILHTIVVFFRFQTAFIVCMCVSCLYECLTNTYMIITTGT